jgi:hypothetical protein
MSLDSGWLGYNMRFIFSRFEGDPWERPPAQLCVGAGYSAPPVALGRRLGSLVPTRQYGFYGERILHCDSERPRVTLCSRQHRPQT